MTTAEKLRNARRELDECSEWLERITREIEAAEADVGKPEVVGAAEAAEILGISVEALKQRRARGTLPPPIADLACGMIWMRRDIERMATGVAA